MQKFEERELIEFECDGNKVFGVLHRPIGEKHPPIVIFCHGLAGNHIGRDRLYVQLSECLSRIGIASLRFDFRGSGDSEGDFGEMTLEGEVRDAIRAVQFARDLPNIDSTRLGIFGRSFGGAIAIHTASEVGVVRSLVLWAPVFTGKQWEEKWEIVQTAKVDEEERHKLMRINGQMPSMSFYKELISMRLDKELLSLKEVPILLVHGEQDPVVRIDQSEQIVDLRVAAPAETAFHRLEHSDHDFTHPEEKLHAINLTCQWFAKTL